MQITDSKPSASCKVVAHSRSALCIKISSPNMNQIPQVIVLLLSVSRLIIVRMSINSFSTLLHILVIVKAIK